MTLIEKQKLFPQLLILLLEHVLSEGYDVTLGEAYRPEVTADYYASVGRGIKDSLHTQRLAIDLNLFKAGVYQSGSEAYLPLGEFWEGLSTEEAECCWGGRFTPPDGNHFSISFEGRK